MEFEDPEEWSTEFYGRMKSQLKLLCQVMLLMMMYGGGDNDDVADDDDDDGGGSDDV